MFGEPDKHGDIFSAPVASEVVGLVVGDVGTSDVGRDLIVQDQAGCLQKVQETHRKFMLRCSIQFYSHTEKMATMKTLHTGVVLDQKLSNGTRLVCLNFLHIGFMIGLMTSIPQCVAREELNHM